MIYPFTPMAIIDLLSILPVFNALNDALRTLRVLRLFRALRAFKLIRYSKSASAIAAVFEKQREALLAVSASLLATSSSVPRDLQRRAGNLNTFFRCRVLGRSYL